MKDLSIYCYFLPFPYEVILALLSQMVGCWGYERDGVLGPGWLQELGVWKLVQWIWGQAMVVSGGGLRSDLCSAWMGSQGNQPLKCLINFIFQ